jgi:hypothetical protein
MTAQIHHTMRELDSRSGDGIYVRLLWNEHDGRLAVAVADEKTGDAFAVEVRDGDRAIDVFHHPYAYAAWRKIDTRGGVSPSARPVATLAA